MFSVDYFQLLFKLFVADFIYNCVFFGFVDHFYILKLFDFVDGGFAG